MQAGKISYAEFERSEAKRAANRLRDQWKKDPWVHGRTIDLGEHEMAFQGELLHWNGSRRLAPAVLDWLRWKFRRLQIDRAQNEAWALLLRYELPRRVRDAGKAPLGWLECDVTEPAAWSAGEPPSGGKRRISDVRRAQPVIEVPLPVQAKPVELDPVEVAEIVNQSRDVLRPLLALCRNDNERDSLVVALVNYVKDPAPGPHRAWLDTMQALKAR